MNTKTAIKWLGVVATAGMFVVLVMGATVTNTGSEQGCGRDWPLCHGKFIPEMATTTAIEFSHRAVVGVESVLILGLAAGALYLYKRRREIQILSALMVAFLFAQAGLGAWAVIYPQEAGILALHFGVSLIAFASVLLTTVFLFEVDGSESLRDRLMAPSLRRFVWALAAYSYVVVYLGAYVRHAGASDACSGWPLCNGAIVPALQGGVRAAFGHRLGAAILVAAVGWLVSWTWRLRSSRPDLFRASVAVLILVFCQAMAGAIVVWTDQDLFSRLLHAALVGLLFGGLAYLCMHVLPRRRTAAESSHAPALQSHPGAAGVPW
jgi:heme a synthase